ncbi:MAG TPA: hypothetical protein PLF99_03900 [Tenuifilaceae bacterium]|nr:hypothetical protein [Tenuifilaceae bacterium]
MMHKSTRRKAMEIQELVAAHFEEGRQDRCKLHVYRHIVKPKYGISERTFFRYLKVRPEAEKRPEDQRQLKLF